MRPRTSMGPAAPPNASKNCTGSAAQGRARSELVVKTDSTVPRTLELACSYSLIFYYRETTKDTVWAGWERRE
eukprot:6071644-Pleurochrysis_carterae.AAC.1